MSFQTPSPCTRASKRLRETPNSSDTDVTPPKKRSRWARAREVKKPTTDLGELLCHRLCDVSDPDAIAELKCRNKGDQDIIYSIQKIIDSVKRKVSENIEEDGEKILEVELYLRWLEGFDFVLTALENVLNAKLPGTRRRVPGLGKISFAILYHLLDEFVTEVNAHQDGWSYRYPAGPVELDPLIMSLAEEANNPLTDDRSVNAIRCAEKILSRYDAVMVASVRRYKSECNKKLMAASISRKEDSLAKSCCLLSEQTGYGGTDDMGFNLLSKTRGVMMAWKVEFEDEESPGYESCEC